MISSETFKTAIRAGIVGALRAAAEMFDSMGGTPMTPAEVSGALRRLADRHEKTGAPE
jgi:hypothetical protein